MYHQGVTLHFTLRMKNATLLALGLLVVYGLVLCISPLRTSFDLVALGIKDYLLIRVAAIGWGVILRRIWRARLIERFLLVDRRKYMYLLHPCEDKTQA